MGEWKTVRVGDLAASGSNAMATGPFGSAISSRYFRTAGVPVIRGGNLSTDSGVRLNDKEGLVFLEPIKADEFSRSKVRRGDLIFTCWGTINQIGLIDASARYPEYVISNKQMKLTPNPQLADSEFLYYLFSSPELQSEILEGSIGSSIPGFNLTRLRSLILNIPPLDEQHQIAAMLRDAELVENRARVMTSKRREIRQGMVQELLSGRTRLPGFGDQWPEVSLASVTTGLRGSGLSKERLDTVGLYPCLLYGELFTTYGRRIDRVRSRTSSAASVQSKAGDVLVPGSTTTVARDLATASALHVSGVLVGGDTNIIRPGPSVDSDWLAYYITHQLRDRIAEVAQGLTIKHLYVRDLLQCAILLPPIAEQRAIVGALSDVEEDISALGRRVEKARVVKNGMMQELLTGRTRLPVTGAVA